MIYHVIKADAEYSKIHSGIRPIDSRMLYPVRPLLHIHTKGANTLTILLKP